MQLTRRFVVVYAVCVVVMGAGGWSMANAIGQSPTVAVTHTLHETRTRTTQRVVTVKVRGRVLRRHDHVLVVQVPRYVFRERRAPHRRVVVPAHIVRVKQPDPPFGVTAAVIGVAPPPITVTVPVTVTVDVPGPTVTLPQATTTVTVLTTVTVPTTITVPQDTTGASAPPDSQ